MLLAHGLKLHGRADKSEPELLKLRKQHMNPWAKEDGVDKDGLRNMLHRMNGALANEKSHYIIKANVVEILQPGVAAALRAVGASMVNAWRENSLDYIVCNVRDCFLGGAPYAWPVTDTGELSDLCFERRHSPMAKVHYKAFFNDTEWMLTEVLKHDRSKLRNGQILARLGWPDAPSVTYEGLTAHEEQHVGGIDTAISEWSKLLSGWRVTPNETLIRMVLLPQVGTRKPAPHNQTVFNYNEVRSALGKPLGFFRDV
eukprot:6185854-Pleurochrysis_carterae.AAC.2